MAGNSRDVTLTLSVDTLGKEGVDQLRQSLATLTEEGGKASPEFQRFADEIDRLGQQTQAVQSFRQLAAATEELRTKQADVSATALQIKERLDAVRLATEAARDKQREATQALNAGQVAYIEAGTALRVLKTEYDAAGKKSAQYRSDLQTLTQEQGRLNAELVSLRQAQSEATAATTVAEAAQRKLEGQYQRSEAQVQRTTGALSAQESALSTAAEAARALGLTTDDMAEAETRLLRSFEQTETAIQAHTAAVKAAKAAAAEEQWQQEAAAAVEAAEAAQRLARETEVLAATQRELAAQRAFEKQAQEAQKLREAAQYVREFEQALQEAEQQQRAMAAASTEEQWRQEAFAIVEAAEAAQRLARETEVLAATQRELAAQRAFEKQAQEAQKLREAAQYVRELEAAIEAVERPAREAAAAFQTLGRQSVQDLERQIVEVRTAMERVAETSRATGTSLTGAFAAGEAKIAALQREIRELTGTLTLADKASALFKNSLGQITAGNLLADAIGAIVERVKEMGRAFISSIVQLDQMRRGLNAIYKDAGTTAAQIEFLRSTTNSVGVSFGGLSKEFVKFSAAMTGAKVPLAESNALFAAMTRASAALGLGAEETSGALNALGQMASKGVVSMEELRQQLGDRLPGAFGLVAKGLGITEAQLVKLVESGQLAARDVFPALTQALQSLGNESDGLVPTWERLKGLFTLTAQNAGDAGVYVLLTGVLKILGGTVSALALGLSVLLEGIFLVGAGVTALAARLTGDAKAFDFFSEQVEKATGRLTEQANAFNGMLDPQRQYAAGQAQVAIALDATATASVAAANAATGAAKALELKALAAKLAADGVYSLSAQMVQFDTAAAAVLVTLGKEIEASEKLARAAKEEGDTLVALAKLKGDQKAIADASVIAAERYAAALATVAEKQQAETEILELQLTQLAANAQARGLSADATKTQREALENKIRVSRAETEQSRQAAEAARQNTLAQKLNAEAYRDNSARVEEYRKAMIAATAALQQYETLFVKGAATAEQVAAARERATAAQARYTDAMKDSIVKIDALNKLEQANTNIKTAGLDVRQRALLQQAEAARASGDYTRAIYFEIEAKRIEIQLTKISAEAKKAEADATVKAAQAQLELLKTTDPLNEAKRIELETTIANAKAKAIEAGASVSVIRALESEVMALHKKTNASNANTSATNANTAASNANADATNRRSDAWEKIMMQYTLAADYTKRQIELLNEEAEATERAAEAKRKYWSMDKEGFSVDANGKRIEQTVQTQQSLYNEAKNAGLTASQAKGLADRFKPDRNGFFNNTEFWRAVNDLKQQNDLQAEQLAKLQEKQAAMPPAPAPAPRPEPAPARTPGAPVPEAARGAAPPTAGGAVSGSKTINLQINGAQTTPVNVVSETDAQALNSFMRRVESAKGVAL